MLLSGFSFTKKKLCSDDKPNQVNDLSVSTTRKPQNKISPINFSTSASPQANEETSANETNDSYVEPVPIASNNVKKGVLNTIPPEQKAAIEALASVMPKRKPETEEQVASVQVKEAKTAMGKSKEKLPVQQKKAEIPPEKVKQDELIYHEIDESLLGNNDEIYGDTMQQE